VGASEPALNGPKRLDLQAGKSQLQAVPALPARPINLQIDENRFLKRQISQEQGRRPRSGRPRRKRLNSGAPFTGMGERLHIGYALILSRTAGETRSGFRLPGRQTANPRAPYNFPMRLFVAIPMAEAAARELSSAAGRLRSPADGLRWTAPESWHITLQFLGNASRQACVCLATELGKLHLPCVPLWIEKLGLFDRAGILLAAVQPLPELLLLQERVIAATRPCGFIPESRPYQPHITLARAKGKGQRKNLDELQARIRRLPAFTRFMAREFFLYESFLASTGSRYEVRARFPLDGD
jgi:2'-5' RNA ligase